MQMLSNKLTTLLFVTIILFASCRSMTVIQTEPAGATVYIDGRNAGPSPVEMVDTKVVTSCTDIRIEKDGYQRKHTEICRNEQPAVGPIIGGFFLLVPWLWAFEYQPSHFYELKPLETEEKSATTTKSANSTENLKDTKAEETMDEKLIKLKDLYEKGLITEDEYKAQKAKVLDGK